MLLNKFLLFIILPFFIYAQTYDYIYGLEFPSNTDEPDDDMVAFRLDDPQEDGLPIWGPNDNGVTYIWEFYSYEQESYMSVFWWSNNGAWAWNGGTADTYYGCNPWPLGGTGSSNHYWEVAGCNLDADNTYTREGSPNRCAVTHNRWYKQAFRVKVNANNTKRNIFYIDLPDTSDGNVIEVLSLSSFGESLPPNPALTFGENPWWYLYGHERLNGILGRVKIIDTVMTIADIRTEAADMTELKTAVAQRNIWWGINNFESNTDLTCDYGTGRYFTWDNSNKATIIKIDSTEQEEPPTTPEIRGFLMGNGNGKIF